MSPEILRESWCNCIIDMSNYTIEQKSSQEIESLHNFFKKIWQGRKKHFGLGYSAKHNLILQKTKWQLETELDKSMSLKW